VAILAARPRRPGRDLIFGDRQGPFSGWSQAKRRLDANIIRQAEAPLQPWTLHDLRRTAVTGMVELGIAPHVVEAVVNHVSGHKGGVAGIYNRASYAGEKRAALDRWVQHVERVVSTSCSRPVSNVVALGP
jgi:integrase